MSAPTAAESRALLERLDCDDQWPSQTEAVVHLRAALDREAEALGRAKIAEADKFKMRDERDKAKIAASNCGNFAHDARKRAEKAEAERDAARAEVERLRKAVGSAICILEEYEKEGDTVDGDDLLVSIMRAALAQEPDA